MGRKRITEVAAKRILYASLGKKYSGVSFNTEKDRLEAVLDTLNQHKTYAVKVDQGIKGRFKKGLIALDKSISEIQGVVLALSKKGYSQFIIEPYFVHESSSERYLALERVRDGIKALYATHGGIDIESHTEEVKEILISDSSELGLVTKNFSLPQNVLQKLVEVFNASYISFLEINPLVVMDNEVFFLDVAAEVDSAGEFFADKYWSKNDYADVSGLSDSQEEKDVKELASQSQASFKFEEINKDGSIFVLLSGGGASVVVADEVYNLGFHKELANYGEYSGNPNTEETYLYTKAVLSFLLKSKSKKKVLIIGGGVANFTDIRLTFKGVIQALSEKAQELRKDKVKIFVRRGGPHQKEGLLHMSEFLKKENLYGDIKGPEMVLTDIVHLAIKSIKK